MNPKLQARVAHPADSKALNQRPPYYDLVKFAVEKEVEINFDKAKKTRDLNSKPKATVHFHFNSKSTLPVTPAVQMVAPAPEEGSGEEATPLPSKESDSGKFYKATQEDATISQGDVELPSEWHKHQRHLQVDVSDSTRLDIDSVMRSVKCMTLNF